MRSIIIAAIVLCFATSIQGHAQEKNIRAGIGVSLSTDATGLGYYNFYGLSWHNIPGIQFPIEFGKHFRIEPELGFMQNRSKAESSGSEVTDTYRGYRLGVSASYLLPNVGGKEYLQASFGGRFAIHGSHSEDKTQMGSLIQTRKADRTDIGFGAFVGAEYFPVKEFSVGGELGMTMITAGETKREPEDTSISSPDGITMGLYGSLNIRWFIF